jgi:predicted HicB family RNase H-like nuclease
MPINHRKNGSFRRGHKAAQKHPIPCDDKLHIRVPGPYKRHWEEAAKARGVPLSEWVVQTLAASLPNTPTSPVNPR